MGPARRAVAHENEYIFFDVETLFMIIATLSSVKVSQEPEDPAGLWGSGRMEDRWQKLRKAVLIDLEKGVTLDLYYNDGNSYGVDLC